MCLHTPAVPPVGPFRPPRRAGPVPRAGQHRREPVAATAEDKHAGAVREAADVRLVDLRKQFGEVAAVDGVTLEIRAGEFFSLLGPSGCGKTTTLRMIGGFELPTAGRILLGERDVTMDPPERRPVNMVFQSYALFPHLTVFENIAFGLRRRKTPDAEVRARVGEALDLVHLAGYDRRKPGPAVGRPAAAGRPRPRARQPAAGAAPRRAAGGPGPQAPARAPGGAQAGPARGRDHVHLRDPRPGGGARAVRPDRGHERRQGGAAGHARGALRPAAEPVRGRLHRHDQPPPGGRGVGRRARSRSCGSTTASGGWPRPGDASRRATRWTSRSAPRPSTWSPPTRAIPRPRTPRAWRSAARSCRARTLAPRSATRSGHGGRRDPRRRGPARSSTVRHRRCGPSPLARRRRNGASPSRDGEAGGGAPMSELHRWQPPITRRSMLRGMAGIGAVAATGGIAAACGVRTEPPTEAPAPTAAPPTTAPATQAPGASEVPATDGPLGRADPGPARPRPSCSSTTGPTTSARRRSGTSRTRPGSRSSTTSSTPPRP